MRGILALAEAAALAPPARAELVIDGFTVGGFFRRMTMREAYTHEEGGLDRARSAWGHRALMVNINSNPNNTYLDVTVGGDRQRFESPLPVLWRSTLLLADPPAVVDFTGQTRINVDYNSFPPNVFADTWQILVRDAHGREAGNGNWLLRPEGIYFEIADFSQPVAWSRIEAFRFTQNFHQCPLPEPA
ncbi:MAG: hypothetical protein AB7F50_08455 [Fimbriimonadaceae bacterium]